ncbi:MAG: Universal stress protein family protein [Pedosphaera sp.]|nr:Universal stress protein family protein [Pedosphaera sp.]
MGVRVEAAMQSWWMVGARKALEALLSPRATTSIPKPAAPTLWSDFARRAAECGDFIEGNDRDASRSGGILVPIDFSPLSLQAVDCAIIIAKRKRTPITLLHAITLNLSPYGPANVQGIKQEMRQTAAERLARMTAVVKEESIPAGYVIEEGQPAAVIEDYLADHPADLLVLALHKHRGLGRLLARKTAEHVIRHTHSPVLIVTP